MVDIQLQTNSLVLIKVFNECDVDLVDLQRYNREFNNRPSVIDIDDLNSIIVTSRDTWQGWLALEPNDEQASPFGELDIANQDDLNKNN